MDQVMSCGDTRWALLHRKELCKFLPISRPLYLFYYNIFHWVPNGKEQNAIILCILREANIWLDVVCSALTKFLEA